MNRREVQPAVLAIVGKWSRLYQRPLQQSRRRSEATRAKIMCPRPAFSRVGRIRTSRTKGTSEGIPEHHPLNYILLSLSLDVLFSYFAYFERNTARQDLPYCCLVVCLVFYGCFHPLQRVQNPPSRWHTCLHEGGARRPRRDDGDEENGTRREREKKKMRPDEDGVPSFL